MILCGIHDVRPGDVVGAAIAHPAAPGLELLKPGVVLDQPMLSRIASLGVPQVWIEDDATSDLDGAVAGRLTGAKMEMFQRLKQDLRSASQRTVSAQNIQNCRQSVLNLVCELIANGRYAGLTDSLFGSRDLGAHASSVAYLSILVGLEVQAYIIKERPRLAAAHARDMSVLGLAGMLHDIGKAGLDKGAADRHEVQGPAQGPALGQPPQEPGDETDGYLRHTLNGYQMLRSSRGAASVTQAVLNHHQRFDGSGWPDMAAVTQKRRTGTQAGRQIHIFTRIVSAANVLDNLLGSAPRTPPVAALHAFASPRFDGWFDPIIRRATLRRIPPFAMGTQVRLSDGRKAVVVAPNMDEPCRPMVRALNAPAQAPLPPPVNLAQHPDLHITHYLGEDVTPWLYTMPTAAAVQAEADAALARAAEALARRARAAA